MVATLSVGLLLLRLVTGLTVAVHGTQKLFGWFGGSGLDKLRQGFEKQGFQPAWLWSSLVILGEVGGGVSLALGFLTPLGAAGVIGVMVMATFKVHWKNGFIVSKGGFEYTLVLATIGIAIGLAGPGDYSLDALFGIAPTPALLFIVLAVVALIVDVAGLLLSRAILAASPGMAAGAAGQGARTVQ